MKLIITWEPNNRKEIQVDPMIDGDHLKEICCREVEPPISPAFCQIRFQGKLLIGEELVENFGVVEGSEITVICKTLKR